PSNALQVERAVRSVIEQSTRKVGVLGFSFKAGSDDLRDSPVVELTERLLGKGFDLRVYDSNVRMASLHGANRDYILNRIPHISGVMVPTIDEVLEHADTIVIGNAAPDFRAVPRRLRLRQTLIDLLRVCDLRGAAGACDGIWWCGVASSWGNFGRARSSGCGAPRAPDVPRRGRLDRDQRILSTHRDRARPCPSRAGLRRAQRPGSGAPQAAAAG